MGEQMIKVITDAEMQKLMAEDRKAESAIPSKMITLTNAQQKIYNQALIDGYLESGLFGEPMTPDISNVVDYLSETCKIELQVKDNNTYDEMGNVVTQRPQSILYDIEGVIV